MNEVDNILAVYELVSYRNHDGTVSEGMSDREEMQKCVVVLPQCTRTAYNQIQATTPVWAFQ